jgi:hypothetical protein
MIEASPSAYPGGMLRVTTPLVTHQEETSRRFSTHQPPFDCGIDLQARPMDVCVLSQSGDVGGHRTMPTAPETFLPALAPYRQGLGVAVAWMCPWDRLADRCAAAGLPLVLGHALSMQASHGGKATHDPSAAPPSAARRSAPAALWVSRPEARHPRPAQASPASRTDTGRAPGPGPHYQAPVSSASPRDKDRRHSPPGGRCRTLGRSSGAQK